VQPSASLTRSNTALARSESMNVTAETVTDSPGRTVTHSHWQRRDSEPDSVGLGPDSGVAAAIWILATPISSVGPSISSVTFDIEDFDIEDFDNECPYDIEVLHLRYRMSISKVFDIEGLIIRYRRSQTFDIEGHEQGCRHRGFMPSISNLK
jgi:hypothetical protein